MKITLKDKLWHRTPGLIIENDFVHVAKVSSQIVKLNYWREKMMKCILACCFEMALRDGEGINVPIIIFIYRQIFYFNHGGRKKPGKTLIHKLVDDLWKDFVA